MWRPDDGPVREPFMLVRHSLESRYSGGRPCRLLPLVNGTPAALSGWEPEERRMRQVNREGFLVAREGFLISREGFLIAREGFL